MTKTTKPFGGWDSPLSPSDVAGAALRFGLVRGRSDGTIFWSEGRPTEQGRCVIMRKTSEGDAEDLLPPPYSARSRVHEYGGGEFTVAGDDVFFVNNEDQDIYRLTPGEEPQRVTNEPELRFADIDVDYSRNRLVAVAERQSNSHDHPQNLLVTVSLEGSAGKNVTPLVKGQDFYASPVINPAKDKLAWISWNLPDMPWDSAALWVAPIKEDGSLGSAQHVAGDSESAVFQPSWKTDGTLTVVWDKSGFANLYTWNGETLIPAATDEEDFSRPLWSFGMRSYAHCGSRTCVAGYDKGQVKLRYLEGEPLPAAEQLRSIESLVSVGDKLAALASSDTMAPAIVTIDEDAVTPIRTSGTLPLSIDDISSGEPVAFQNKDNETVYGYYYPPTNRQYEGPTGEKPPILFTVHGGPTGMGDRGLKLKTQYWTSRGFGVFDTDYSGSAGYGRAYMRRLDGLWGIKDVSDIADAAAHMVAEGLADPKKLFITGSSAGGMTVLLALADHNIFAGGTCTYGVTDLSHLLKFTHKFEAGYLYRLLGISPGDDTSPVLSERAPISKAEQIDVPVIFFQGLDDKVVPPEQSRRMVDALRKNNVQVEYVEFEGEAHGFRRAETIQAVLEQEYAFYKKLLKIA